MTVPAGAVLASATFLAAYREWERLTNDLAVQSARLAEVVGAKRYAEAYDLAAVVESLVKSASDAAGMYASYKIPIAPEVIDRWKSVLRRSQDAIAGARNLPANVSLPPLVTATDSTGSVSMIDAGFRFPGTSVVVPWVAVVGVAVVVGVGFYFSRRNR